MKSFSWTTLLLLLLFPAIGGFAQITVTGNIYDYQTYQIPPQTTVRLVDGAQAVREFKLTNANQFTFENVNPGKYTLKVDAPGYQSFETSFTVGDDYSWMAGIAMIRLVKSGVKLRTRQIDYAQYDRLTSAWATAANKRVAIEALLKEVNLHFTPEDEEYFMSYAQAGMVYNIYLKDVRNAIRCYELALGAYEKNTPLVARYAPIVNEEMVVNMISSGLGSVFLQNGMSRSAIQVMESFRPLVSKATRLTQISYLMQLANAYLMNEHYDSTLQVAGRLKNLLDSSEPLIARQMPVFNGPATTPEEEKMRRSTLRMLDSTYNASDEITRLIYRSNYYRIMGSASFNRFAFAESATYLKLYQEPYDKYTAIMLNQQRKALQESGALADTLRNLQRDAIRYMEITNAIGMNPHTLIACRKSGISYSAASRLEEAVDLQLKGNFVQSERTFQDIYKQLNELAAKPVYKITAEIYREKLITPYYQSMLAAAKQYDRILPSLLEEFNQLENSLQENFSYFSEDQRKEYFQEYSRRMDFFNSVLLSMAERDPAKIELILNKSLQTRGLILEVTREQDKRYAQVKDPAVKLMIEQTRQWKDKIAAFMQMQENSPGPGISDSINRLTLKVNQALRQINQKIGVPKKLHKAVTWKSLQSRLRPGEGYLEIIRVQRNPFTYDAPEVQYWGILIQRDKSPQHFLIGSGSSFEIKSLRKYQNSIRYQLEDLESYGTYWKPIADQLTGVNRLTMSSDGVYHLINPATLYNPASASFVLDQTEVILVATGRDLLEPATTTKSLSKNFALVGNPDFTLQLQQNQPLNNDLGGEVVVVRQSRDVPAPLPGAELEVQAIAALARPQGFKPEVIIGAQATESKIKTLGSPALIHLATHGVFKEQPGIDAYLKSMLLLAGAADQQLVSYGGPLAEDGLLTAFEVTRLDLSTTELVVLSACETGLGEVQQGEGVWGLLRAFQVAGARRVLGSLWKISDEATVRFMTHFYTNYLATANAQVAYRFAMQTTRKEFPEPYYWGAFRMVGEGM